MEYFYIHSGSLDACTVDSDRFDYTPFALCSQCQSASTLSGPVELHLQNTRFSRSPIKCVQQLADVGVISREFTDAMPSTAVSQCLILGTVYGGNGNRTDRWHSFHSPFSITVRGTKHVTFRTCPECGRHLYFAVGDRHLCPAPPKEIPIFHAGYGTLVVNSDVFNTINGFVKGKLYATALTVCESPRDGGPMVI
jgi:hypothetical protein